MPIVDYLYPAQGPETGGWSLTLDYDTTSRQILRPHSLHCRFHSDDTTVVAALDIMTGSICIVPELSKLDLSSRDIRVEISVNLVDWIDVGKVYILPAITLTSISPSYGPLHGGQALYLSGTGMKTIYSNAGNYSLCCEFDGTLSSNVVSLEYHRNAIGTQVQCITPQSSVPKPVYVRVVYV